MTQAKDRKSLVRESYRAYQAEDREAVEQLFAADFTFSSPADVGLDRDGYFERCWPNDGRLARFDLVRLVESGAEVIATYEATRTDGTRFRNTEIHRFVGDRIVAVEVYFGWNLE